MKKSKEMGKASHEFEKSSILLFCLLMIGNVCNYIYQITMGRMLSLADYGTLNALLSLTTVIGVPAGVLQMISSKYSAHYTALNEPQNIAKLLQKLSLLAGAISAFVLIVGVVATPAVANVLQIEQRGYVVAAMVVVALGCIVPVLSGTLQGLKRFLQYGLVSVISIVGKLVFGVVLLLVGWGVYGNLIGLALGSALSIAFGAWVLRGYYTKKNAEAQLDFHGISHYFQSAFWAQTLTMIMTNGDVLLVKAFAETEAQAGVYSSAMVLGKIPMYVSASIISVLFPMTAEQQTQGKSTRGLLMKALVYGGGISVLCAAFLITLGNPVILMLFGQDHLPAAQLLFPVSCFIIPLNFIMILMNYLTALGRTKFLTVTLIFGAALILGLVYLFHSTTQIMLYIMGGVLLAVFIINLLSLFLQSVKRQRS